MKKILTAFFLCLSTTISAQSHSTESSTKENIQLGGFISKSGQTPTGVMAKSLPFNKLKESCQFFGGDTLVDFDFEKYSEQTFLDGIKLLSEYKSKMRSFQIEFVKRKFHLDNVSKFEKKNTYRGPVLPNPLAIGCDNLDFENGDLTSWTVTSGVNPNSNAPLVIMGPGVISTNQDIYNCNDVNIITNAYGVDAVGLSGLDPFGGTTSVRLGGYSKNIGEDSAPSMGCVGGHWDANNANGEVISKVISVTAANALMAYDYQVALNDGSHANGGQPYFLVYISDTLGNTLSACTQYYVQAIAGAAPVGFVNSGFVNSIDGSIIYTQSWVSNSFNLSPYIGQNVVVSFVAAGCIFSGHFAFAYVDAFCGPVEIVPSDSLQCLGATIVLTAPPSQYGSYIWSGPGIIGSTVNQTVTVDTSGIYTVTITPTQGAGCAYTLTEQVSFKPLPTVSITTIPDTICEKGTVALNAIVAGGSGIYSSTIWTGSGSGGLSSSTIVNPTFTDSTSGYYQLLFTVTDNQGCIFKDSTTVTVKPNPLLTVTTSGPATFCSGGNILLDAGAGHNIYSWGNGASSQTINDTVSGSFFVTVTDTNGCSSSSSITITVNPSDNPSFIYSSATYCQSGVNPTPVITGTSGGTFISVPAGLSINSSTGTIDLLTSTLGAYTVSYVTAGICPDSSSILITITNSSPSAIFTYSTPTYCQNGTAPSPVFGSGASAGIFSAVPAGLVFVNVNTGQIDLGLSAPGTYTIINTIPAIGSCAASSATTTVVIIPPDDASFTYSSATYCTSGVDPTPTITGLPGGIFSASPSGLSINPSTGTISLSTSLVGSYILSYATIGPCPFTSSITMAITNATPSTSFSYSSSSFCQNAANPFPVYVSGAHAGTFSAAPAGIVFVNVNTGEIDLSASAGGTYTVTNTISASGTCLASIDTAIITINSAPVVTNSSILQIGCNGTTISIPLTSSLPGTTFSWTIVQLALSGASVGSGPTINQTLTLTGTSQGSVAYTITPSNGGCSGTPLVIPIIINPILTVDTSGAVVAMTNCGSNTGSITGINITSGQAPYTYVWHDSTGAVVGNGLNLNNIGAGIYSLTITDANGCSTVTPVGPFTINSAPGVTPSFIYSSATYCQSGINPTPVITGLPGGVFSTTPAGLSINPSTGTINLSASTLGVYTLSYTNSGVCPNVSSITMTITNVTPSAIFSYASLSYCQNGIDPFPIFASGASAGIFSANPAGLVFVHVNTGQIDLSASSPGTYTVINNIPPSGTCSSASDTTTVIITPSDDASFTYPSATFCISGTNPTPTITGVPGGVFSATPSGLSISPSTGTINLSASALGSYTLSYSTSDTCPNSSSITLTIANTTPSSNYSYSGSSYCQNMANPFPVFSSGASAGIFTATPAGIVFVNVNTGEIDLSASAGGIYTITNTIPVSGTCLASSDSAIITINPTPIITNSSSLQTVCNGALTTILLTSSLPGTIFSWTIVQSALSGASAGSGSTISQTLTLTGTSQGSVSYTIIPSAGGCFGTPVVLPIIVNQIPSADTTGAIVSMTNCSSNTGSITGITMTFGQPPFTYVWHDSSGAVVGNGLSLSNAGPGIYSLTVTDVNGCSTGAMAGPYTITTGTTVTAAFTPDPLTGETPLTVNFTNNSVGGVSYLWQFGTGDTSSSVNPSYVYVPVGSYTVCLIASDSGGCYDTACFVALIDVQINSVFIVPNIFTPNDDNINDVFTVMGRGLKTLDAEIYNRWGEKLYEWHTINGGWNGYTASGVKVSDGTYYYIINATSTDGKSFFKKGAFSLEK